MATVGEIRKRIIDGNMDYAEIRRLIKADGRLTRALALVALSHWIGTHENSQADQELVRDLAAAALDPHPHSDQWMPGTDISARFMALGCLSDIGTPEAAAAIQDVLKNLKFDERAQNDFQSFLRERRDRYLW